MRMLAEVKKLIKLNFNKIKDDSTQLGANKGCLICSGLLLSYLGFITETPSEELSLSYLCLFSVGYPSLIYNSLDSLPVLSPRRPFEESSCYCPEL